MNTSPKIPETRKSDSLSKFQQAYLAGDQRTMRETYQQAHAEIVAFARTRTYGLAQAMDLADQFIEKWLKYLESDTPRNPRAFMCTSIRNLAINAGKQRTLHREKQETDIKPQMARSYDPRTRNDEVISQDELSEVISRTLKSLKEKQQKIWALHSEGYSNGEIADTLAGYGLNADRVSYHKNAVRVKLIEAISAHRYRISLDNLDHISSLLDSAEFEVLKFVSLENKTLAEIAGLKGTSVNEIVATLNSINQKLGLS